MTPNNTDLPILDELGSEFAAMVSAAWAGEADGSPAVAEPRRAAPGELRLVDADERAPAERAEQGDGDGVPVVPDRHTARRRLPATPSRAEPEAYRTPLRTYPGSQVRDLHGQ